MSDERLPEKIGGYTCPHENPLQYCNWARCVALRAAIREAIEEAFQRGVRSETGFDIGEERDRLRRAAEQDGEVKHEG